jgi:tRNA A-37 threonylcarbamoyl transferase component Bud32
MPDEEKPQFEAVELIRRFKEDERAAAGALYDEYANRLLALTRTRLPALLARRLDPEDILQSVFRSFVVGLREDRWRADEIDDLWRLLAGITLNKLGEKVRFNRRLKRSGSFEVEAAADARGGRQEAFLSREPSPADVVAAADELVWLLSRFSVEERLAIELRLARHSIEEIAIRTGRSQRTIRRWLSHARELLESRALKFARPAAFHPEETMPVMEEIAPPATLDYRDFRIERLIGSGGVCKVYAARRRSTNEAVCIKVMRKRQRYLRQLIARFLYEAAIVSELSHPRIVSAHGVGRLPDGGYFMSVALVNGPNLLDAIKREGLRQSPILERLAQISDALGYCHEQGVVHCDVQPRNILLDDEGRAMLTDFGFARRFEVSSGPDLTDSLIAGTPGFMAPEQIEGVEVGPATDVYGIGAVLYWVLTSKTPNDMGAIDSGLCVPDQFVSVPSRGRLSFPEDVRTELCDLCERCLARSPAERTITTSEISSALRAIASVDVIDADSTPAPAVRRPKEIAAARRQTKR